MRSIPDDLDSLLAHMMNGVTLGRSISIQDSLSLLEHVNLEQIIEHAKNLTLETSFILTSREVTADA
jgi:hypothetical protein